MRGMSALAIVGLIVASGAATARANPPHYSGAHAGSGAGAGSKAAPPGPAAWIGVFRPAPPGVAACADCAKPTVVGATGEVIVLSRGDADVETLPAAGDVTLVQPLLGMNVVARVSPHGRAPVALFAADRRDGADAVLVLAGAQPVTFVPPTPADVQGIRAALLHDDVLAGVKRSLAGIEIGAIDVDGDRKADFAVTYGCNAWADGSCQGKGEFLLRRTGATWHELE